jgi:ABC-type sugar transport system ATPase subunit
VSEPTVAGGPGADGPQREDSSTSGVSLNGVSKRYGDTIALDRLDLEARPGEILGVAGPNGAGKSTMVKILAGEVGADSGEIHLDGRPWQPALDRDRVAAVHQEPQLFPNMSVGDNLLVGREDTRFMRPRLDPAERALMSDLAISEFANRTLGTVPLAVQQRTEICRALARDARVFLFDEPNSALTPDESRDLFRRIHALAQAGKVVILVSHRLAELVAHCSRVAIILDGRCAALLEGEALTQEAIASELVVGQAKRDVKDAFRSETVQERPTALRLTGWDHQDGEFAAVDLHVRIGDILAFVGVEGSGARELVRSVAGFEPASGQIELRGRPGAAGIASDTAFVSADRQQSLFTNFSVRDNVVSRLGKEIAGVSGALRRGRMARIADAARDKFQIRTSSLNVPVRSLSGGNQQKVAIAAAIVKRPEVLVLEEPTRGVDIGAKAEIYRLMREYAQDGHALIIYCTEVPEVFEVADVVYVVSDGRLSEPIVVMAQPDVEALARAITRLERHSTQPAAA